MSQPFEPGIEYDTWKGAAGLPKTRGDCLKFRQYYDIDYCPFASCRWHLIHDFRVYKNNRGVVIINGYLEPHEMACTCALDFADETNRTLERTGKAFHLTRERIRQIEVKTLHILKMICSVKFGNLKELYYSYIEGTHDNVNFRAYVKHCIPYRETITEICNELEGKDGSHNTD
jgi:hypothetical protein